MIAKSLQIQVSTSSSRTATLVAWDVQSDGKILWKTKYFGGKLQLRWAVGGHKLKMWPVSQRLARLVTKSYQGSLVGVYPALKRHQVEEPWGSLASTMKNFPRSPLDSRGNQECSSLDMLVTALPEALLLSGDCGDELDRQWVFAMLTSQCFNVHSLFLFHDCYSCISFPGFL